MDEEKKRKKRPSFQNFGSERILKESLGYEGAKDDQGVLKFSKRKREK